MKKILMSLLLIGVTSLAFCDEPIVENQKKWSANGVSIIGRLKHKKYLIKKPIVLEMLFKNNSNEDIIIILDHIFRQFKFTVFDKKRNKTVPLTIWGQHIKKQGTFSRATIRLKKNDSYKIDFYVNRYFDLSFASEYSISFEGTYANHSYKFIPFKVENIIFMFTFPIM